MSKRKTKKTGSPIKLEKGAPEIVGVKKPEIIQPKSYATGRKTLQAQIAEKNRIMSEATIVIKKLQNEMEHLRLIEAYYKGLSPKDLLKLAWKRWRES